MQTVGQPVNGNGFKPGIAKDYFVQIRAGGITVVGCLYVHRQDATKSGDGSQEIQRNFVSQSFKFFGRGCFAIYAPLYPRFVL